MPTAQALLGYLEATIKDASDHVDPCSLSWIRQLQEIVDEQLPTLTPMRLFSVYRFYSKKYGWMRGVVTKENGKSWIVYEVEGSVTPGMRWTWYKSGCVEEVIRMDDVQSYTMPANVKFK